MKKLLALVLALVMTLSLAVVGSNAAFKDAKDTTETYAEAVDVLSGMGVFNGYKNADGTYSFQPKGEITRAEVAAIVYRLYTADVTDKQASLYATYNKFTDMGGAKWAAGYIGYCANAGLIKGYDAKTFGPSDKVTGYQALAMILRAVGYDKNGEFTGADWQLHVAQTAQQLGILKNVKGVDLNAAATRELVAELLFRTAAYVPMVTYTPALGYTNLTAILNGKTNATLGQKNFGLTRNADTQDDWGRPYYTWTNGKTGTLKVTYATIKATPVATYYVATSECDIAAAMGLKKAQGVATWVNANKAGDTKITPTNTLSKIGAQGRTIEVYEDRLVIIDTYLAKVTKVAPAEYDAAGHLKSTGNYTMIDVYDGYTNQVSGTAVANGKDVKLVADVLDYAKGDYILVNFKSTSATVDKIDRTGEAKGEMIYNVVGKAESFTGAQTNLWINANKHTVDGKEYLDACQFHLDDAGYTTLKNFTWFLDAQGNLIGAAAIEATYTYAILKDIIWNIGTPGSATATLIDAATGAETTKVVVDSIDGAHAKFWDAQGATPTLASYVNTPGFYGNYCYVGFDTSINNELLGYALYRVETLSTGAVVLEGVDAKKNTVSYHVDGTTVYNKGTSFGDYDNYVGTTKWVPVNDATVFTVRTNVGTAAKPVYEYKQYTGKMNVPTIKDAEVFYVMDANNFYAKYVYIKNGTPIDQIAGNFVLATNGQVQQMKDSNTVYDYLVGAYINGVIPTDASAVVKAQWYRETMGKMTSVYPLLQKAGNVYQPFYVTYLDDGSIDTVAPFTTTATKAGTATYYMQLDSSKITAADETTLVVNGSTYSIHDAKLVGTAVKDVDKWTNYNVYIVYTTETIYTGSFKVASQLYIIDTRTETPGEIVDPSTVVWTKQGNYEYTIISGTAPNYVGSIYTASQFETLGSAATTFVGTMYVTAPDGLMHQASAAELGTSVLQMVGAGYKVQMQNQWGTWTFVATK